jgi:hypothetical protein
MSGDLSQYVKPTNRLAWSKHKYTKYYGKKNRGLMRGYLNQNIDLEINNNYNKGYYFTEDRPITKVASPMTIHDSKEHNSHTALKRPGIQINENILPEYKTDSDNENFSHERCETGNKYRRIGLRKINPTPILKVNKSYVAYDNRRDSSR